MLPFVLSATCYFIGLVLQLQLHRNPRTYPIACAVLSDRIIFAERSLRRRA